MPEGEPRQKAPISEELVIFKTALAIIRHIPGKKVSLLTTANDTVSGYKQTYSEAAPLRDPDKLNAALNDLISLLVPEGENRQTLEMGFKENLIRVNKMHHGDLFRCEWLTVFDGVAIGIEAVRDHRSESSRSFYLRNIQNDK